MISFFGASVTQQKSGYAVKLKSRFADEEVSIFGYGGMHLNNAGVIYIDKVLQKKPSYCFVDWFSTEYTETNQNTIEYIDTIVYKFTEIKCKLIFLFFVSSEYEKKKSFYTFCKNYLADKGLSWIDLNDELSYSTEVLRDNIHTTEAGSEKYADIIFQKFNSADVHFPSEQISKTKYCDIKTIEVDSVYTGKLELTGNAYVLGFLLTIGRHSGVVEIWEENKKITEVNTWDRWCHYDREHFNLEFNLIDACEILITDKSFDTSACKINDFNFSDYKKKLVVHSIHYIGKTLQIKENFFLKSIARLKYLLRINRLKIKIENFVKGTARKVLKR